MTACTPAMNMSPSLKKTRGNTKVHSRTCDGVVILAQHQRRKSGFCGYRLAARCSKQLLIWRSRATEICRRQRPGARTRYWLASSSLSNRRASLLSRLALIYSRQSTRGQDSNSHRKALLRPVFPKSTTRRGARPSGAAQWPSARGKICRLRHYNN